MSQTKETPFRYRPLEERQTLAIEAMNKDGQERVLCIGCGRVLFKGKLGRGTHINIKCSGCKEFNKRTIL